MQGGRPGCQRSIVLAVPLLIGGEWVRLPRLVDPDRAGVAAFERSHTLGERTAGGIVRAEGGWDRWKLPKPRIARL